MAPAARRYFSHGGGGAYLARVPERRQIAPKKAKSISLIRRTGTRRALSIRARPGAFHRESRDIAHSAPSLCGDARGRHSVRLRRKWETLFCRRDASLAAL